MPETKNYHLGLTDDDSTSFKNWRELLNGLNGSNMVKIDDALGGKADQSQSIDTVLSASAWSENAPYTQTLSMEGLTENGVIGVSQDITDVQMEAVYSAKLRIAEQSGNTLTIKAVGDKPNIDIPVTIILLD